MMPLEKNSNSDQKNQDTVKISEALSTDEILSLLSKNKSDFVKDSEISETINNLFKKVTPSILAEAKKVLNNNEKKIQDEKKIQEENVDQGLETQIKEPEKKYTEEEAQKMAKEYANQYYNNGYKLGVKKTTEELQKGDKALAVTLKQTTDNIFGVSEDFAKELNQSINNLISKLCEEVIGYVIDNYSQFFQEKIEKLTSSIENSIKNVDVFLNPKDHDVITKYNNQKNIQLSFKINPDNKLDRGDVRIKSGSIEMSDIVSNKIKFSNSSNLSLDLDQLKDNPINKKTEENSQ